MVSSWVKESVSKDSTNLAQLNSLNLTVCCNLKLTIVISSLDMLEGILEKIFFHRKILGMSMISTSSFVRKDIMFIHSFMLFRSLVYS